jgi:hypothetical protein
MLGGHDGCKLRRVRMHVSAKDATVVNGMGGLVRCKPSRPRAQRWRAGTYGRDDDSREALIRVVVVHVGNAGAVLLGDGPCASVPAVDASVEGICT